MLGKLLKYDLKSVWRIWWIAAVSALGASVIGSFALRFLLSLPNASVAETATREISFIFVMSIIFFMLSIVAIIASVIVMEILVYWRFYKHFFSDEGYLTFTLPVSRKKLLFSKTLNALIWTGAHTVLLTFCAVIFMLIAPPPGPEHGFFNPIVFQWVGNSITELFEIFEDGWLLVYFFVALLISLGLVLFSISLIHFCITLGAVIAKKHKLFAAIGTYYLITSVISYVCQGAIMLFSFFMAGRFMMLMMELSPNATYFAVLLILLVIACIAAALASMVYFLTLGNLERKLNLE